jgi:hypothetical protein
LQCALQPETEQKLKRFYYETAALFLRARVFDGFMSEVIMTVGLEPWQLTAPSMLDDTKREGSLVLPVLRASASKAKCATAPRLMEPQAMRQLLHRHALGSCGLSNAASSSADIMELLLSNDLTSLLEYTLAEQAAYPVKQEQQQQQQTAHSSRQQKLLRSSSSTALMSSNSSSAVLAAPAPQQRRKRKRRRPELNTRRFHAQLQAEAAVAERQQRATAAAHSTLQYAASVCSMGLSPGEFDRLDLALTVARSQAEAVREQLLQTALPSSDSDSSAVSAVQAAVHACLSEERWPAALALCDSSAGTDCSSEQLIDRIAAAQRVHCMAAHLGWQESPALHTLADDTATTTATTAAGATTAAAALALPLQHSASLPRLSAAAAAAGKRRLLRKHFDSHMSRDTPRVLRPRGLLHSDVAPESDTTITAAATAAAAATATSSENPSAASIAELRAELEIAQAGLAQLNERVTKQVAWVQQHVEKRAALPQRTAAVCSRWGAAAVAALLARGEARRLSAALLRWRQHRAHAANTELALDFLRASGAAALGTVLGASVTRRQQSALCRWRALCAAQRRREQSAAAALLQRCTRGLLARRRVRRLRLTTAALAVQRRVRGGLGRRAAVAAQGARRAAAAAVTAAAAATAAAAKREATCAARVLRRRAAATSIQRIARGRAGRRRARAAERARDTGTAVTRIQAVYRGHRGRARAAAAARTAAARAAAAPVLQRAVRCWLARLAVARKRAAKGQSSAALRIQGLQRQRAARRAAAALRTEREAAAAGAAAAAEAAEAARVAGEAAAAALSIQRLARGAAGRYYLPLLCCMQCVRQCACARQYLVGAYDARCIIQ